MQLFQNLQIISLIHEDSSKTWLDFHEIYTYQATFKFGKRIYLQKQITQRKQNQLQSKQLV